MQRSTRAFTLLELLAAIAVITVLVSMLFVGFRRITYISQATKCVANLKTIGVAAQSYIHDNNGYFLPHNTYAFWETNGLEQTRKLKWAWMTHLSPYLGSPDASGQMSQVFKCPSDPQIANWPVNQLWVPAFTDDKSHTRSSYGYNYIFLTTTISWWKEGGANYQSNSKKVTSPSSLILFTDGRRPPDDGATFDPIVNPFPGPARPDLRHSEGFNAVFLDGHVENMKAAAALSENPYWRPQK